MPSFRYRRLQLNSETNHWTAVQVGFFLCLCTMTSVGCNRSQPYLASQPVPVVPSSPTGSGSWMGNWLSGPNPASAEVAAMQQQLAARESDLTRRMQVLDDNNRQLQSQLAQAQQQAQLAADERALLRRQLQDASGQLQQSQLANAQSESRLQGLSDQYRGLQASSTLRGGAKLTANRSLRGNSESLSQLGFPVFEEGDVLRLRIPADQLFTPNTATLTPTASQILDQVADVIKREFARQRIGVEGHTDAGPFYGGSFASAQQLAAAQSTAVVEHLQRRNQLPTTQLFSLAHGTNHAIADNQTPTGRSQNRRVELVIYPDTF